MVVLGGFETFDERIFHIFEMFEKFFYYWHFPYIFYV